MNDLANKDLYFVLHSTCKTVKGFTRSILVDYGRGSVYYLTNAYYDLLQGADRTTLGAIESQFDEGESLENFHEFLGFLVEEEIAFLTDDLAAFPPRSDHYHESPGILEDIIIELDPLFFDAATVSEVCRQLDLLRCSDVQLRVLSAPDYGYLAQVLKAFNDTCISYLEVHLATCEAADLPLIRHLVEHTPKLTAVYAYDAPQPGVVAVTARGENTLAVSLGQIYLVNYSFAGGNCCGIINAGTLVYNNVNEHNRFKKRNGCLDKKIAIDREGNIKNCPSLKECHGNLKNTTLPEVVQREAFRKYWRIAKDQISTCKSCEFRYNCSDCRAFLTDPEDRYSKPLKCGYDPFTGQWEQDTRNPLRESVLEGIPG